MPWIFFWGFIMKKRIFVASIIILQVVLLFLIFAFLKKGNHSDEIYNYGFSNSYYIKDLTQSNDGVSLMNKWNDSQLFKDYITVDFEHRFAYKSVLKNCSMDLNPPLHFLVLHTICSFFPGVFSWYFCFAINIVAFVITQIFIYLIANKITNNYLASLSSIILYGFGIGAMDITTFLRFYAMGVMFVVVFFYFSLLIYENRKKKISFYYFIASYVSLFLGAYTMHIFLVVAFSIVFCYVVYYLFAKNFRLFFVYGLSCLSATILSIVAYPKVINNVGQSSGSYNYDLIKYPFLMQLRLYSYQLTKDLFGIHISPVPNPYLEWFLIGLVCLVVLLIPICFIFRKEIWFINLIGKIKNKFISIIKKIRYFKYPIIIMFVTTLFLLVIVSAKTSIYIMTIFANRYLFACYPLAVLFVSSSIYYIIKLLSNKITFSSIITFVLCLIMVVWTHLLINSYDYLILKDGNSKILENLETDANCILVLDSDWSVVCFAPKLYKTNSYFATNYLKLRDADFFTGIDKTRPLYLIYNAAYLIPDDFNIEDNKELALYLGEAQNLYFHESEFFNLFTNEVDNTKMEYIGEQSVMKRDFVIYKIVFDN